MSVLPAWQWRRGHGKILSRSSEISSQELILMNTVFWKSRDEAQGTKVVCCRMDQESTNSGVVGTHGQSLVLPSVAVTSLSSHIWPICFFFFFLQNN